jgi:hypothetical protein
MKKSIISLLFLFAVCVTSNMVFAQTIAGTPISGTSVGLEHDPEGIAIPWTKTDQAGKFSFKLPEGKYKLSMAYYKISKAIDRMDKNYNSNPDNYEIDLMLEGIMANGSLFDHWGKWVKATSKLIITKETGAISVIVPKGGGMLNGTLTCVKIKPSGDIAIPRPISNK